MQSRKTINNIWAPPATAGGPQIHTRKVMNPEPDPGHDQLPQATHSENTNLVFFKTFDLSRKFYTDQTGRFPVTSIKDNKYILVTYHYDSNTIQAEPLKTTSSLDLTSAYQKLHSLDCIFKDS